MSNENGGCGTCGDANPTSAERPGKPRASDPMADVVIAPYGQEPSNIPLSFRSEQVLPSLKGDGLGISPDESVGVGGIARKEIVGRREYSRTDRAPDGYQALRSAAAPALLYHADQSRLSMHVGAGLRVSGCGPEMFNHPGLGQDDRIRIPGPKGEDYDPAWDLEQARKKLEEERIRREREEEESRRLAADAAIRRRIEKDHADEFELALSRRAKCLVSAYTTHAECVETVDAKYIMALGRAGVAVGGAALLGARRGRRAALMAALIATPIAVLNALDSYFTGIDQCADYLKRDLERCEEQYKQDVFDIYNRYWNE